VWDRDAPEKDAAVKILVRCSIAAPERALLDHATWPVRLRWAGGTMSPPGCENGEREGAVLVRAALRATITLTLS
jgi:hypothetical protein